MVQMVRSSRGGVLHDANHRCGMQVRTRFWASLDGWPGTFRPSGFKQTQIPSGPYVMAILVGPLLSPNALTKPEESWPHDSRLQPCVKQAFHQDAVCCLSNKAMTRNVVGGNHSWGETLESSEIWPCRSSVCFSGNESGPPAVALAWFLMSPWQA